MLEFLVLGVIPGTTIQITFGWFVAVSLMVSGYIILRTTYQNRIRLYRLTCRGYSRLVRTASRRLLVYIRRHYTLAK
jgi:hypothetical protein